jgi:hypothetical protein
MGRYRSYKKYKRKSMRGGYSDSASYMESVVGNGNDQYNRVFQVGGPNNSQSNAIMSVTGQRAGGRRGKGKRGGSWVSDAIVPAAFIAGSYLYSRRKGSRSSFRKTRRRRR